MPEARLGGPCPHCGIPQVARAKECPGKEGCAYAKDRPAPVPSPAPATVEQVTPALDGSPVTAIVSRGKQIRLARMLQIYIAVNNLQQKDIAEATGVHESNLSRWLAGRSSLDAVSFAAILAWCIGPAA